MASLSVDTLNIDRLRASAGRVVFDQGQAYFDWGRVQIYEIAKERARCYVTGSRLYEVELTVSEGYLYLRCDCNYAARNVICKHEVASVLAVREKLRKDLPVPWTEHLGKIIQITQAAPRRVKPKPYLLFFSLQNYSSPGYNSWKIVPYQLPLSSLSKEMQAEVTNMEQGELGRFLEQLPAVQHNVKFLHNTLNPDGCVNGGFESVMLANVMIERSRTYSYFFSTAPLDDYLAVIRSTGSLLFFGTTNQPLQLWLRIMPEPGKLNLRVVKDETHIRLSAGINVGDEYFDLRSGQDKQEVQMISAYPTWLRAGQNMILLENETSSALLDTWAALGELEIPIADEENFVEKYYLKLAQSFSIEGDMVAWEEVQAEPVPRLYLSDAKGKLQAHLRFGYADFEVPYESTPSGERVLRKPGTWTLVRLQRNLDLEEQAYRALSTSAYRLKRASKPAPAGLFYLRANAHPVDFLLHSIPQLAKDGYEIYGEEKLKTLQVNRNKPTLSFRVSSGIDWFDVKAVVNFGEIEVALKDIRKALRKKERYIKLADGSIGEIPDEWLERYKHLFALSEETQEGLRLSNHHLTLLDQVLEDADQADVDPVLEQRRQRLRSFTGITPVSLPQGFCGELRPYQKSGYDWLHFLHEYHYGGCLADDMGLGKTIQVLAFLQSLYDGHTPSNNGSSIKPSLVIVPRSLLVNWQREAGRFTPNLRILEYFDKYRTGDLSTFDSYNVVITTYGVMLRDITALRTYPFHYAILDESQTIKNPISQTSRAVRQLRAEHRLVLTGTPVENSSVELWSQFAFLNPGLLGSLEYFQNEFSTPIEKKGDEQSAQFLRKLVFPFILRRTKAQVAPELPERSERTLYTDMEPNQRKLYNRTRDYYRGMLMGMLEKEGFTMTRMKILEGLLRLRQIANHPRLVDEKFKGSSGKFDLLLETLDTLRSEGHKALVYSQFVKMLALVREPLDERKVPYVYLDGQTQNRQERVDTFQQTEEIPFFLISLKAGGVGLNLTAADYVIHIDPWWNPAVEMQASDRTHRIGQDKPVFVYKLITRDSVEEKIIQLQERKRQLVDQIITTESSFFKSLEPEDIQVLFS
jgi:non-specific serine/threonine protein kinase